MVAEIPPVSIRLVRRRWAGPPAIILIFIGFLIPPLRKKIGEWLALIVFKYEVSHG